MSQPIRGQGGHLVFPMGPKNTNLVEGVEILLPVKFRKIPFNGFRGEVENVSANQRPGRPSCFSDRPQKNTNLVEDVEILLPVKFRWIPLSGFRGEIENVEVYAGRTDDDGRTDGRRTVSYDNNMATNQTFWKRETTLIIRENLNKRKTTWTKHSGKKENYKNTFWQEDKHSDMTTTLTKGFWQEKLTPLLTWLQLLLGDSDKRD